jgi:hypothetical protein
MKLYLAICVMVGFLLGAAFVVENERYDMRRHGGNDEWWTWTAGRPCGNDKRLFTYDDIA